MLRWYISSMSMLIFILLLIIIVIIVIINLIVIIIITISITIIIAIITIIITILVRIIIITILGIIILTLASMEDRSVTLPCATSSERHSVWPLQAALCKGVLPYYHFNSWYEWALVNITSKRKKVTLCVFYCKYFSLYWQQFLLIM